MFDYLYETLPDPLALQYADVVEFGVADGGHHG
jgi:hypothetical protein